MNPPPGSAEPPAAGVHSRTDHDEGTGKGIFRGTVLLIFGRVISTIAGVATLAVLARLLDPRDFGVLSLMVATAAIAQAVIENGIAVQILRRPDGGAAWRMAVLWVAGATGVVLALAILLLREPLARTFGLPHLDVAFAIAAGIVVLRSLAVVTLPVLQVEGRFRDLALLQTGTQLFFYTLPVIALAASGFGVWALLAAQASFAIAECLIGLVAVRGRFRGLPRRADARMVMRQSLLPSINGLINWGALSAPNMLIGKLLGVSALGLYSRANALQSAVSDVLGSSLFRVLFPTFTHLRDDRARFAHVYRQGLGTVLPLSALAATVAAVHSALIVRIFLGIRWEPVIPVIAILFAGLVPRMGYKITESITYAAGSYRRSIARQTIYVAAVASGVAFGVRTAGLPGAAAGVVAGNWIMFIISAGGVDPLLNTAPRDWLLPLLRGLGLGAAYAVPAGAAFELAAGCHPIAAHVLAGLAGTLAVIALMLLGPDRLIGEPLAALRKSLFRWVQSYFPAG